MQASRGGSSKTSQKLLNLFTKLLEKDAKFAWDEYCQGSFEKLKTYLTTAPVVRTPNWQLPFEVMYNASDLSIGAISKERE